MARGLPLAAFLRLISDITPNHGLMFITMNLGSYVVLPLLPPDIVSPSLSIRMYGHCRCMTGIDRPDLPKLTSVSISIFRWKNKTARRKCPLTFFTSYLPLSHQTYHHQSYCQLVWRSTVAWSKAWCQQQQRWCCRTQTPIGLVRHLVIVKQPEILAVASTLPFL